MRRLKRSLAYLVPGLLLLGGLSGWAGSLVGSVPAAQEEPHKPPEEDPTSPAYYLWQVPKPDLISDEPLQVTVPAGLQP
ncbi:MAG: hypothetical protein ACXWO1_16600, partial [Isosphaeraceae bacterium]